MNARDVVKNLLVGFLIGIAFVLPGVSGAVIAVVFGIYARLVFVLSDLRRNLKAELTFVVTIALGLAIGMIVFSALMNSIPGEYESIILLAFVGLIIGQVPEVYKLARKDNEPVRTSYVVWLAIGVAVMLSMLLLHLGTPGETETDHSVTGIILAIGVGLLMGASGIVPGMSGPTILTALGLYGFFTGILGSVDLLLLLPMGIGALIGVILVSKVMVNLLENYYYPLYYAILGLTIGSIIVTFFEVDPDVNILLGVIVFIIGLVVSLVFSYLGKYVDAQDQEVL